MNIVMYVIAVEAAVRLWFCAAPLQGLRYWLITQTPMLSVSPSAYTSGGHLFECKYCTSVWIGAIFSVFYFFLNSVMLDFVVTLLVIHRISNFVHLLILIPEEHVRQIRLDRSIKTATHLSLRSDEHGLHGN